MRFMGINIRRVILEIVGTVGEKVYKFGKLNVWRRNHIHISLKNNRENVWENQRTF
jgi:hypothetical protein